MKNLFPMPRNRTTRPTDATELLHVLAIAIRDGSTHARLRKLIAHFPKIMNRVSPFNATEKENMELRERITELEAAARKTRRNEIRSMKQFRERFLPNAAAEEARLADDGRPHA